MCCAVLGGDSVIFYSLFIICVFEGGPLGPYYGMQYLVSFLVLQSSH